MCTHHIEDKKTPRPRFSAAFRLLWVVLSKLTAGWDHWVHLMQPATVKRWHTRAFSSTGIGSRGAGQDAPQSPRMAKGVRSQVETPSLSLTPRFPLSIRLVVLPFLNCHSAQSVIP